MRAGTVFALYYYGMEELVKHNAILGFTLIELMIVVVIIGVLSSLAIPRFSQATRKAKYSQARLHLKRMYQALTVYYADNGCYPRDTYPNIGPGWYWQIKIGT